MPTFLKKNSLFLKKSFLLVHHKKKKKKFSPTDRNYYLIKIIDDSYQTRKKKKKNRTKKRLIRWYKITAHKKREGTNRRASTQLALAVGESVSWGSCETQHRPVLLRARCVKQYAQVIF